MSNLIKAWPGIMKSGNQDSLEAILADNVVFHSPVVHRPQIGKAITTMYLMSAFKVLANDSFVYQKEVIGETNAVLEFVTEIDGIQINGVDIISWNDDEQITEFKVMVRPLKAMNLIHQKMGEQLELLAKQGQ